MDVAATDSDAMFAVRRQRAKEARRRMQGRFQSTPAIPADLSDVTRFVTALAVRCDGVWQEEKLKRLIEHKKLKLLPLQREFKKEILTERYLSDAWLHDERRLMEWTMFDAALPRDKSYFLSARSQHEGTAWKVRNAEQEHQQIQKCDLCSHSWREGDVWTQASAIRSRCPAKSLAGCLDAFASV